MAVSTKRKNSLKSKSNSKTRKQFKKFRKTKKNVRKMKGGGNFTEDDKLMRDILVAIEFYNTLYKKYNTKKEMLIDKWTQETKDNQYNQDKLSLLMKSRDADIMSFIEELLRDLETEEHKKNIKEIITKEIEPLILTNNDTDKDKEYKIKSLMNKYTNLINYLNMIKIDKQPKQELSRNELERRVAEAQAKRERNEEARIRNAQMETNIRMASERDKQSKLENHKDQMKKNEEYIKKYVDEIKLLNDRRKEYIDLGKPGKRDYTSKIDLLNSHIKDWYSYTDIEKERIITKIPINMI